MDRDEFLNRVRTAAIEGRKYPVEVDRNVSPEVGYVGGGEDLVATFLNEWKAVGGQGERVNSDEEAVEYIRRVIKAHGVRGILLWRHPLLERLRLAERLSATNCELHFWDDLERLSPEERRRIAFGADLGVTSVDRAIAETGSLVMFARSGGRGRSASLLPPVHIAVLEPAQLIPDLFDLTGLLEGLPEGLPSNATLITGPSKTGDIQLKLTTGVHGPGEVHAIVIDSDAESPVLA